MCVAVIFIDSLKKRRNVFRKSGSVLPYVSENLQTEWSRWGRPDDDCFSIYPAGGFCRRESLESGVWDRFTPERVMIPAQGFIERSSEGKLHEFYLLEGEVLQAVTVSSHQLIYLVTRPAVQKFAHIHDRFPAEISVVIPEKFYFPEFLSEESNGFQTEFSF